MDKVAPISLCLIVKNEPGLNSCLASIRPYVEEICIVDTGSTDNKTQEIAKKYADKFEIYTDCNNENGLIEDFSEARNRSFSLATKPWVMWIDGDDVVQGADKLVDVIKAHEEKHLKSTLIMFPYEYSHDDKGNVTCLHYRERLVKPKEDFIWRGPVHETLNPLVPVSYDQTDVVKIIHRRNSLPKKIEPNRNLRILKKYFEKVGESDVRQLYYLGLEYGNSGDIENSIKFHKRYVELSGWDDEKFQSCLQLIEHNQNCGNYDEAINWAFKALTIKENWSEAYFSLGKSYYFLAQRNPATAYRNWERAVYFIQHGLKLPPTETVLFVNPVEREFEIHRYLNYALSQLGRIEEAYESVQKALSVKPEDESLKLNKKFYEVYLSKIKLRNAAIKLREIGEITAESYDIIDNVIEKRPILLPANEKYSRIESSSNLDIAFYVGYSVEHWNPDTIKKTGIGGSEIAVWEVGRRLAKSGNKVRVYGDCPSQLEGTFEGVEFLHYDRYNNVNCDVLITSRRPHVVDNNFNLKSKIKLCWVHDVHCGEALTHQRALRIDKFLCLSDWHKNFFLDCHKNVHQSQVITTRNGIDLNRFQKTVERNPHRAVYSSSPDRGLEVAIRAMPLIRQQVPDAELHIYYGFKNWEICAIASQNAGQLNLINHIKQLIESHEKHGVYYHDRISQDELAVEFLKSGVWAYSTFFSETSCITAMEAQAAGLRIVTSPIAALNETVGNRGVMIPGDWLSLNYMNQFSDAVAKAMIKEGDEDRKQLREYAFQNFGWDSLVNDWNKMFVDVMEEVRINVLPPYKAI